MSHHDVPSDVVIITPAGKAHRGIRHESGAIESDRSCHLSPPASADTDINEIMDLKAFKGATKRSADLCGHCFPPEPAKDKAMEDKRSDMEKMKDQVTGADKVDEKTEDKPMREAASHRKSADPKKSDMEELKDHVTGADKVDPKKDDPDHTTIVDVEDEKKK